MTADEGQISGAERQMQGFICPGKMEMLKNYCRCIAIAMMSAILITRKKRELGMAALPRRLRCKDNIWAARQHRPTMMRIAAMMWIVGSTVLAAESPPESTKTAEPSRPVTALALVPPGGVFASNVAVV